MNKYYKLADKIVNLNIDFACRDGENLKKFEIYKERHTNIVYNVLAKDFNFKNKSEQIYSGYNIDLNIEVYEYEGNKIYFHKFYSDEDSYSCLIEKYEDNKYIGDLFIRPDKLRFYFGIDQILKRINLQAAFLRNYIMILHSSFIIYKNKSILFTAPSGVGKSTQASLWEKYEDAEIINGDRAAIGVRVNKYFAYGLPFSGSSNICKNKEAPIKVIVALEQSKDNSVRKLSKIEAFKILLSQVAINRWNKDDMNIAMDLIEKLIEEIPVLLLSCRPDKEATEVLKNFIENL